MKLYFVTSNKGKVKEAEDILGFNLERVDLDIDEIQAVDVEKIAKDKAQKAWKRIKKPVIVEDTGFYIEAWNGFPGALVKWTLKTMGNDGLCQALGENRRARVKTCVSFYDGKKFHVFSGELEGEIPEKPRGDKGFGWDPIFVPEGCQKTFGEMEKEEKNKMSMRKIALSKMKKFLK